MSVTASSFKAEFPEFINADDALVNAKIAEAALYTPANIWGAKQDLGIKLAVAEALALTPEGRSMQLATKDGDTIYSARLAMHRRAVASGGRVI